MGLFGSILKSVTNSVVDKIGDEVKVGISNKIQEGVNDLSRNDDTINNNIALLKDAMKRGKEEDFLKTVSLEDKKAMVGRLAKKQLGNAFSGGSTSQMESDLKCFDILSKSIGEDAKEIKEDKAE